MRKAVWFTFVGLAAISALGVGFVVYKLLSSDEPPIRVRNGSMDVIAAFGRKWAEEPNGDHDDGTPSYSHEPTGIDLDPLDKDLWVRVDATTATCTGGTMTANGRVVKVEYTPSAGQIFTATFKRAKSGKVNFRTKLRPRDGWTFDSQTPTILKYAVGGFVSKVSVGGWSCSFGSAAALNEIRICSYEGRPECQ